MGVSLNKIVDITVQVSNPSTISSDFNLGLIIGKKTAILSSKVKVYTNENYSTQMVADGFAVTDPEYKAAVAYFSQNPKSGQVAIGAINVAGSETPAEALTAIRGMNDRFYAVCFADDLTDSEVSAVASSVEAFNIPTQFYFRTKDAKCIQASQSNVLKTLQDSKFTRTIGFYSNDDLCVPSVVGLVSGLNSMEVNSAYTAAYKTLVGVTPENLTDDQLAALTGYCGNAYTTFGNRYQFTYPCISSGNYHIDDLYMIDASTYLIQQNTIAGLVTARKIPQTEDGMSMITSFISSACDRLAEIGMISGGIWKGDKVLDLNTGDAIEGGYRIQSGSIADQSASDRAARKSPPIYVALLSSGAIEHVVIRVYVNR